MNQPLVSICIPNYNNEQYIVEAIESCLHQTYWNIEIIVVDNGSTDNSWNIISCFEFESRVKLYRNSENIGMIGNFRRAFELSVGDFITFLCSDDFLNPNAILQNVELLIQNSNASFVFGNIEYVGGRLGKTNYTFDSIFEKGSWSISSLDQAKNFAFLTGTVFRRNSFPLNQGQLIHDLVFFDWYLWLRLGLNQVIFNESVVGIHRYHSQNQTNVFTPDIILNTSHLLEVVNLFEANYGFVKNCENAREGLIFRTSMNLMQSKSIFYALSYSFDNSSNKIRSAFKIVIFYLFRKLRLLVSDRSHIICLY